jgi:uncharacterized protein (TIGR03435 family)
MQRAHIPPAILNGGIAIFFCALAFGQAAENLTFEVASVKPAPPPDPSGRMFMGSRGGPGTPDPGQITWTNATLKFLLMSAYDVKQYQVTGPAWLDTERYNIVAKVPDGATKEQVAVMWQNLLKERFGMVLHHESKEFQVRELVVAKGGSKLKETTLDPNAPPLSPPNGPPPGPPGPPKPEPFKMDKNGFPEMDRPGLMMMIQPNAAGGGPVGRMVARAQPISGLAGILGNQLDGPVLDKTGLTGKYDFNLEYMPDLSRMPPPPPGFAGPAPGAPSTEASEPGSNLAAALEQQLGLRLVSNKAKLDVVVVDKAEKTPTEN